MEFTQEMIRVCLLYDFKCGLNARQSYDRLSMALIEPISLSTCEKWFKKFRNKDYEIQDKPRSGRPVETDIDDLKRLVEEDPCRTTLELAKLTDISKASVHRHLIQMGKTSKCGKWFPHALNEQQLLNRMTVCTSLLTRHDVDPFLERIVCCDEKWVLYVNAERKKQWLGAGEEPIPTAKPGLHPKKVLLCVWWDMKGIIYMELLNMGETITSEVYCRQLTELRDKMKLTRSSLLNRRSVILQQDNAKSHTSKMTRDKLKEFGWEILPHPPYSPDMAPTDYYLFRSLQHLLKGKEFNSKCAIEIAISAYFAGKDQKFFKHGIELLPERWTKIIDNDGHYIIE